jgi:hypothetical protein
MVDTIIQRHRFQFEWIDTFQAAHVVTVLIWERAALMVRVDAAAGAEVVLGNLVVELVQLQGFLAF